MGKYRGLLIGLLILWVGFVFSAFYIVQKPLAIQVGAGLLSILRTLALTAVMLAEAAGLGGWLLRRFFPSLDEGERLFLGTGLGLGAFGLLGFGLVAARIARPLIFLAVLAALLILQIVLGWLRLLLEDLRAVWKELRLPAGAGLGWVPWFALISLGLAFVLAFAPPADSFDALLYHLAVPAAWLRDEGLAFSPIIPHYWFPALVESTFLWGLALGSETTATLLHLAWGVLAVGLAWWWARKACNGSVAWRSVAVLVSMPSLALLAAWSYTDLALAFYTMAGLYALWISHSRGQTRGWVLAGLFSGLAMGVKYTSFLLPVVIAGWILVSQRRRLAGLWQSLLRFTLPAVAVASLWYIRNWIWTGNPVYPFLFGGKSWDPFLAAHYSGSGTGIGLNIGKLLLLPINVTLGQFDANYYDGRIGPLWLILLPISLWVLWRIRKQAERAAVYIPAMFGLVSLAAWTVGVVNTSALWQSRLLFSALLPLAPLAALAWEALAGLDRPVFRLSFIFNALVVLSIVINLLDFGLFVLTRQPLAVAVGITSRQAYFERFQPNYADALTLVGQTPPGSKVYFLFEPRSYGMPRVVTPDAINQNLAHDFYRFGSPEAVLREWQTEGYGYVLYQRAGESLLQEPAEDARLFSMLNVVSETPNTILYRIP